MSDDVSEGEQRALIDSSPLALEFGLDTRLRLWNPAAERIFGWSREEMLGRGGLPMAPPSKRAESEDLFARVRAGESVNDHQTARRRKDGTLVAVSIAAAPVRDGSGRIVSNMVAYTDITDRKAQEAEVHRLNDELHARLEELAASRARIVTAGDVERRRPERNLHDGAQQRLVAPSLSLRLALAKLDTDQGRATTLNPWRPRCPSWKLTARPPGLVLPRLPLVRPARAQDPPGSVRSPVAPRSSVPTPSPPSRGLHLDAQLRGAGEGAPARSRVVDGRRTRALAEKPRNAAGDRSNRC